MSLRTQNNTKVLVGDTLADRPPASTIKQEGTIFHDFATGDCSILIFLAGVATWDKLCSVPGPTGPTGPTGIVQWPDYVVSKGDPVAPFTTISSAIAAALAAGHGSGNPAVILVHPGTYTENVQLRAGIPVVAFDNLSDLVTGGANNTIIAGNVTCAVADSGNFVLNGFTIEGSISCGALGSFLMNYITVILAGASDLLAVTAATSVQVSNSIFNNNGTGALVRMSGSESSFFAFGSTFLGANPQLAILFNNGFNELDTSFVNGQIHVTNAGFVFITNTDTTVFGIPQYQLDVNTSIQVEGGSFNMAPEGNELISGTGTYSLNNVVSVSSRVLTANTLVITQPMTIVKQYSFFAFTTAASFAVTPDFDMVSLPPSGGGATATLPDTRTAVVGRRLTLKNGNGSFAITVNPAAGDTIDGAASYNLAAGGPPFHAVTFQCDTGNRDWKVVAVV
jgi:hypothetical protein